MHASRSNSPVALAVSALVVGLVLSAFVPAMAADAQPFVGNWALTIPGGGAGWLGVVAKDGQLQASLLWGGGSVLPVASAKVEGDQLVLKRERKGRRKDPSGKIVETTIVDTITARVAGDAINLTLIQDGPKGKPANKTDLAGERIPPVPAAPDLTKVKLGEPIALFDGKSLAGWKLMNTDLPNGWSAENGVLINRTPQEEGKPHKRYANIRTEREFEDFNLKLETRVGEGGNSGIYLRGIYEVQVCDSFGKPLDSHNMGGLYSRITPSVAAEKPAGQWQTFDITLVDRHLTVILNGKKIIDNQPVLGCTGGALWSDEFRPGPLYLQGDHTGIEYRNIVLRPVVK